MEENKQSLDSNDGLKKFLDLDGLKTFKEKIELNAPYIGDNGNWFVNKEDTGVKAQGSIGPTGPQGNAGL